MVAAVEECNSSTNIFRYFMFVISLYRKWGAAKYAVFGNTPCYILLSHTGHVQNRISASPEESMFLCVIKIHQGRLGSEKSAITPCGFSRWNTSKLGYQLSDTVP